MNENNNNDNVNNNEKSVVEVIEKQIEDNKITSNFNTSAYSNTNKLTSFVYIIIFISILIGVYFYITQNKNLLEKFTGGENNQTGTINTFSGDTNIKDSSIDTDNNINDNNTDNSLDNKKSENLTNDKDPITSNSSNNSGSTSKSEEVIIEDFEKELDSLFDVIDENAK